LDDAVIEPARVRIQVRWADMDAYGHVNNAIFLNYLEEARDVLSSRLFDAAGYDFVLVRVAIDFRQQITQDDAEVVVTSRVTGYGTSSVRTAEEIRFTDGRLSASAESVLVPRNEAGTGSRPLTETERARLDDSIATAAATQAEPTTTS
jgi:acyl-CoA thioester hydrolase